MEQQNQEPYLLFEIEAKKFLIEITGLEEIIPYQQITRLPKANSVIKGITNFRGEIIGVFDLAKILSVTEKKNENNRLIVVKNNKEKFGIPADKVYEVTYIQKDKMKIKDSKFFEGSVIINDEDINIINLKSIYEEGK